MKSRVVTARSERGSRRRRAARQREHLKNEGRCAHVENPEEMLSVRRQWNDGRVGKVKLSVFRSPHWSDISGGVQAGAIRPFVHGYIWCTEIVEGEIAHSCSHGPPPHDIKVCVIKMDNDAQTFAKVLADAGPRPQRHESEEQRDRRLQIRRARKKFKAASFGTRLANVLIAAGLDGPERLCDMEQLVVAGIPGVGPAALAEIDRYLERVGPTGAPRPDRARTAS
jgi:hypothetical protein